MTFADQEVQRAEVASDYFCSPRKEFELSSEGLSSPREGVSSPREDEFLISDSVEKESSTRWRRLLFIRKCGLCVLVVIATMVVVHILVSIMIKHAISSKLSQILQVEVVVGSADVGFLFGQTEVAGLAIRNPDEFAGDFLQLREGKLDANMGALFSNLITIETFELHGIHVTVEQQGVTSNVRTFMATAREYREQHPPSGLLQHKRFIVEELRISNVSVSFTGFLVGQTDLYAPDIAVRDIGGEDGVHLHGLITETVHAILSAAVGPAEVNNMINGGFAALEAARDIGQGHIGDLSNDLRGAVGLGGD